MTSSSVETSIVIRTLNEAKHLEFLLKGIHSQNYKDWEIVLVDSGSTDGSREIASRYGARIFNIPSNEFTFGRSLNIGCREAKGKYLVFASGHVWPITNNWLSNMIKPFTDPTVMMVYGRQRGTDANRLCEIRDLEVNYGRTSHILVDEANGNNGNAAISRDLWLNQPFDESLPGLEDIDWARKAEKKGYRVYYTADAAVYHVHEESLSQVYRRHLREAVATKTMFPNYSLSWTGFLRALPYFIVRDILYAIKRHHRSKIFHIPATRLVQFIGIYKGVRYHKKLVRNLVRQQEIPAVHKRVIIDDTGNHSIQKTATPVPVDDEVLVQVGYATLNSTDTRILSQTSTKDSDWKGCHPTTVGREFAGVVIKNNRAKGGLRPGQKVAGRFPVRCRDYPDCNSGYNHDSGATKSQIIDIGSGSLSPYITVPFKHLYKLPPSMPLKFGAMAESVAACVEALSHIEAGHGNNACVIGCGPIGNLCCQILRARGVRVTGVDKNSRRLSLLFKHDVDTLETAEDLDQYNYVIECEGNGKRIITDDILVPSNKRVLVRLPYQSLDASGTTSRPATYADCRSVAISDGSWQQALKLIDSKTIDLSDHIAEIEPLEAYSKVLEGIKSGEIFKVLLSISQELKAL